MEDWGSEADETAEGNGVGGKEERSESEKEVVEED